MSFDIMVAGSKEETIGFRLAGVKNIISDDDEQLAEKISAANSIILISAGVEQKLQDKIDDLRKNKVILTIPTGKGGRSLVDDIIKDTIGFDLRK